MLTLTENPAWRQLWDERTNSVLKVLGETVPPGRVIPFSWKQFVLPGACAMTFGPRSGRSHYSYISLGMTQPNAASSVVSPWEFAIMAKEHAAWPVQILYDLLTYWLAEKRTLPRGLFLPLAFFRDMSGELCAGLTEKLSDLDVVGAIRGLYLWDDVEHLRFVVSSGEFRLMVAIAVTDDEIQIARQTTPPHLLLLLKSMRIGQLSEPLRDSVMALPGAEGEWKRIRALSHDEAVCELDDL